MKKWIIWILLICMLSGVYNGCVQAEEEYPLMSSVEQLERHFREQLEHSEGIIRFSYTKDMDHLFGSFEIVTEIFNEYGIMGWSRRHYENLRRVELFQIAYPTEETGTNGRTGKKYPLMSSAEQLEQLLRAHMNTPGDEIRFSYTKEMEYLFEDFEIVTKIFGEYGVIGWSFRHYEELRRVELFDMFYSHEEAKLHSNEDVQTDEKYPLISSVEELKQYLWKGTRNLDNEICFSYSEDIEYIFDDFSEAAEILCNCGAKGWTRVSYEGLRRFEIVDIIYSPGLRIVRALALNRLDLLNQEELLVLDKAQKLVRQAQEESSTTLELEKWIHDELCRSIEYTINLNSGEITIYDTAIGALCYGQAECDGYADAFYLLGTLAGLNVGFQHGKGIQFDQEESHLWNVIEIDGQWYHMDVTWDDLGQEEYPGMMSYRYFNVGTDLFENHYWTEDLSFYPAAANTNWDTFFYTCDQSGKEDFGMYFDSLEAAVQYVVRCGNEEREVVHVMVKGDYDSDVLNSCLPEISAHIRGQMTWKHTMGEYTIFDVLFIR